MKLTINGFTVCFDKMPKEIIVNGSEFTIINNDNVSSKEDVRVSEYTIDNPKLVDSYTSFEGIETFTGVVKNKDGDIVHYLNGQWHRDNGPAIEWANGDKKWYLNNKRHRKDGPAVTYANGDKEWWFNGEIYGDDDDYSNESWIALVATIE